MAVWAGVFAVLCTTVACKRVTPVKDGNVERGRAKFVELQCSSCHAVVGSGLPEPTAKPIVPIVFGSPVTDLKGAFRHRRKPSKTTLATAIRHPSAKLKNKLFGDYVRRGKLSRMPDYGTLIDDQTLADLVAFIRSSYAPKSDTAGTTAAGTSTKAP